MARKSIKTQLPLDFDTLEESQWELFRPVDQTATTVGPSTVQCAAAWPSFGASTKIAIRQKWETLSGNGPVQAVLD